MKIRGRESLPEVRDAGPVAVKRDLKNDPASAAMAAAAGYSSKAGQYVAQGARDLAAGIEKMARDRAEAGALAAYNDYVSRSSHLLYDPNTGLMHAKGAGAEGLSGRAYQAHKALKDEIMSALPAGQRRLFVERTASYDRGVGSACMKLEGEQMSLYKQEEAERTLKTIYTAAALNPDGFSMEAQEDAFREITIARYGDQGPEANLKNSALVRSEFFIGMIQQAAQNDPTRAEALVKEYEGYIEPADAQKLKSAVEKAALPAKAQAFAEEMLKKHGVDGASAAIAETREAFKGKDENVYLGYVNSLYADAKQARNEAREKIEDEAIDLLNNRAGYGRISAFLSQNEAALGPKKYRALKNDLDSDYKVGKYADKPKRDEMAALRVWSRAEKELAAGVYANKDEFYDAYEGSGLKASELKSLANAAFKKKSGDSDPYNKYNPLTVVDKMTKDYNLELDPQEDKAFWTAFSAAAHAKEADLGRKLTDDEIEALAKERLKKEIVRREYNWAEKGLMRLGVGADYFTPDEVTEAYRYQTEAAMMSGVKYNAETNTYYTVDDAGNIKGWEPDSNPKLKGPDKRKIKNKGYYDEIDEIADDMTR